MLREPSTDEFLAGSSFAVVGASADRSKYGNRVLRAYADRGFTVYAVNGRGHATIEGLTAYAKLSDLPERPHGVSIITPPAVTERVVDEALALGIQHLWMQPGAESADAIARARNAGANVIEGGPCILVDFALRGG